MSNWHILIEWGKLLEPHEIIEKQSNYGLQAPFSLIIAVQLSLTANRIRLGGVGGFTSCLFPQRRALSACLWSLWQSSRRTLRLTYFQITAICWHKHIENSFFIFSFVPRWERFLQKDAMLCCNKQLDQPLLKTKLHNVSSTNYNNSVHIHINPVTPLTVMLKIVWLSNRMVLLWLHFHANLYNTVICCPHCHTLFSVEAFGMNTGCKYGLKPWKLTAYITLCRNISHSINTQNDRN